MATPSHPGVFLWSEVLEPHGLTVAAAAGVLGVSRVTLSRLVNGRAALSGDMAIRFEKAFGLRMDTLMRMQAQYDIAEARRRASSIRVRRYRPTAA
jgi:addiction module HigA family antidote